MLQHHQQRHLSLDRIFSKGERTGRKERVHILVGVNWTKFLTLKFRKGFRKLVLSRNRPKFSHDFVSVFLRYCYVSCFLGDAQLLVLFLFNSSLLGSVFDSAIKNDIGVLNGSHPGSKQQQLYYKTSTVNGDPQAIKVRQRGAMQKGLQIKEAMLVSEVPPYH